MSEKLEAQEQCAALLEEAIASGYPTPASKQDQCEHGKFGWEDCIACYDEQLAAVAEKMRAVPTPANGEQVERDAWKEVAQLRTALIAMGRMIPGVRLADDVSSDFLAGLPDEMTHYHLSTPTQDARERVKVLKEALSEAGRMQFAAANIPEGYIDGWADCVEHIRNAEVRAALVEARHEASTALGNQEERL